VKTGHPTIVSLGSDFSVAAQSHSMTENQLPLGLYERIRADEVAHENRLFRQGLQDPKGTINTILALAKTGIACFRSLACKEISDLPSDETTKAMV